MSSSISAFSAALQLRCDLAIITLCRKHGLPVPYEESDVAVEAYVLGLSCSNDEPSPPILFRGTPIAKSYAAGVLHGQSPSDNVGTQEEWDALSFDEQMREWDTFHDFCMLGIADEMYFYGILMSKHLVGYVGY